MKKEQNINNFMDRFNNLLIAKRYLTDENVKKISKKELKNLSKRLNKKFFEKYKVSVSLSWEEKNRKRYGEHLRAFKKIIKKLEIKNSEEIIDRIFIIESRSFTDLRNLKTIETPYETKKDKLQKYAVFAYKNVTLFKNKKMIIRLESDGELFISKNELVIWNNKEIKNIISKNILKKIILKKNIIVLKTTEKDENGKLIDYYIKNKDIVIIYNSFWRIWKRSVDFENQQKQKWSIYKRFIDTL